MSSAHSYHASKDSLWSIFLKYATVTIDGENYMTANDFVVHFLRLLEDKNSHSTVVNFIARTADTSKDGLISFEEFLAFEALLCTPDALYALAFKMFDKKGNGYLHFEDFQTVFQQTTPNKFVPFDFKSDFTSLHFGKDRSSQITYEDFTQIIHDVSDEHAVQAFKRFDHAHSGIITATDFNNIMLLLKGHMLTPFVREHLMAAALQVEQHKHLTFAYYTGFINLLSNMELVKKIYRVRSHGDQTVQLTKGMAIAMEMQSSLCYVVTGAGPKTRMYRDDKIIMVGSVVTQRIHSFFEVILLTLRLFPRNPPTEEFLNQAQHFAQITPMEVDILFQLVSFLRSDGHLTYKELLSVSPMEDNVISYHNYAAALHEVVQHKVEDRGRTVFLTVLEQAYRFTLGSIAGAIGATAVYPIDLVKTRMQNQRTGSAIGELLYKNGWDCFKKVIRFEGVTGLYRGLLPQLVGVAPEKAIKLTMNDLIRDHFSTPTGEISLPAEILSGACAGASQVVFTNPLEIVKIRLQVAGEIAAMKRISALTVIRDLGFFGLYKGARACFLRDIPFSAIYFTSYDHLKRKFADEKGFNSPLTLLTAATLSGAPAAALTTPADVIKTRLQVVARSGQTTYSGIQDAVRKIWREEGGRAFWKGAGARVFRSSPQFGVTLLTYEMLQRSFYVDFGGREPTGMGITPPANPDHIGGFRFATATFTGIETKLGLCFPKYKVAS